MRRVADLMVRDVHFLEDGMPFGAAIKKLCDLEISGLPVVNAKGKLVGMLTEKDIIRAALPTYFSHLETVSFVPQFEAFDRSLAELKDKKVKEFMTKNVTHVSEQDHILEVARLMVTKKSRRLPVVTSDGKLIGIISRYDIVRRMIQLAGLI